MFAFGILSDDILTYAVVNEGESFPYLVFLLKHFVCYFLPNHD